MLVESLMYTFSVEYFLVFFWFGVGAGRDMFWSGVGRDMYWTIYLYVRNF
jgi:hypothetical protein